VGSQVKEKSIWLQRAFGKLKLYNPRNDTYAGKKLLVQTQVAIFGENVPRCGKQPPVRRGAAAG